MLPQVILLFLAGLAIGGFLNVCIFRLPTRRSVVRPRSCCLSCDHQLGWTEIVPVFSYVFQKSRCLHCGERISWIYPIVELTTACSFSALLVRFGMTPALFLNMFFFCVLIVLIVVDLNNRILPDPLTIGGTLVGLLAAPFQAGEILGVSEGNYQAAYLAAAIGSVAGGGTLWLAAELYYRIRQEDGLGVGDVKMMFMIGAFLGWRFVWATIFIGSVLGTLVGGTYMYVLKKGRHYELPYGSFLGVTAMAIVFCLS